MTDPYLETAALAARRLQEGATLSNAGLAPARVTTMETLRDLNRAGRSLTPRDYPDIVRIGGDGPGPTEIRIAHVGDKGSRVTSIVARQEVVSQIAGKIGGLALTSNPFGVDLLRNEFLDQYPNEWITRPHPWVEYDDGDAEWSYPIRYGSFRKNYKRLLVVALHAVGVDLTRPMLAAPDRKPEMVAHWEHWELVIHGDR